MPVHRGWVIRGQSFLDDQVILCPIALVAADEKRRAQVIQAGWDLVVVDEAHHLGVVTGGGQSGVCGGGGTGRRLRRT